MTRRWPGGPGAFAPAACFVFLVACSSARQPSRLESSPGLVFPAQFAEGENQDAGAPKAEPKEPEKQSTAPPDPEPLRQAEQYEYTFEYDTGATRFVAVRWLTEAHDPQAHAEELRRAIDTGRPSRKPRD